MVKGWPWKYIIKWQKHYVCCALESVSSLPMYFCGALVNNIVLIEKYTCQYQMVAPVCQIFVTNKWCKKECRVHPPQFQGTGSIFKWNYAFFTSCATDDRSAISTVSPTSVCKLKNMCNYPFYILFCQALTANSVTRMHSSRMCTARLLTVARSICRRRAGVSLGEGACMPGDMCARGHACHACPLCKQNDRCLWKYFLAPNFICGMVSLGDTAISLHTPAPST